MTNSLDGISWSEKLYTHWTMFPLMIWGVLGLIVIPVWAMTKPTNYDMIIVIGMIISYLITTTYVYIVSEAESSKSYSDGLKRIFDNKELSSEELSKRTDMYRKMF